METLNNGTLEIEEILKTKQPSSRTFLIHFNARYFLLNFFSYYYIVHILVTILVFIFLILNK